MKIPTRILLPVFAALAIVAGLLTYLWWQLQHTTLHARTGNTSVVSDIAILTTQNYADLSAGDAGLLALREGDVLALQGNWKDAQTKYEEAVRNNAGLQALRKLVQAQLQRRDINGAKNTRNKLQAQGAKPEDLLLIDVIILLRTGELVQAKTLLANAPESPHKQYGLALLNIIQGNHESAKNELVTVVNGWDPVLRTYAKTLQAAYDEYALFPESPEIHLITLLSRALAESQQCELALPLLTQVVKKQDDYRDAWIVQGYCELMGERYENARSSLERAYNLDPEKPEIQYFLARAYSALDDNVNAVTFSQYALQNGFEPQKEIRRFLATEAEITGNTALALEQYRALSQLPDADLQTFAKVVSLFMSANQKTDALAFAESATRKWPTEAKAFELLGWVQEGMGQTEDAKANYQKALQLNPALSSAKEKLSRL